MGVQGVVESVGWWWLLVAGIPFAGYSLPFLLGDFDIYKHLTIAALQGHLDVAGLHIVDHVKLWQLHTLASLVYLLVAPFQFNAVFRGRNLKLHRQMGYAFVGASLFLGVSGSTTMTLNSEFGPLGRFFFATSTIPFLFALARAVTTARNKQIQAHRRWMMRTTIIGFGVINSRIVIGIAQQVIDYPVQRIADYLMIGTWTTGVGVVEAYIQLYLKQKRVE